MIGTALVHTVLDDHSRMADVRIHDVEIATTGDAAPRSARCVTRLTIRVPGSSARTIPRGGLRAAVTEARDVREEDLRWASSSGRPCWSVWRAPCVVHDLVVGLVYGLVMV